MSTEWNNTIEGKAIKEYIALMLELGMIHPKDLPVFNAAAKLTIDTMEGNSNE